ncbi:RNA 2',3'-cyclic phosphodiesterase [Sphingomonas sp.]|uniref:RNA 2',3'-cyclic phosphodiesterase n=1 Tax=Sphingomonas sp. TaxID=28214 RepID=UPI001DA639F1|nr:RNA 2',3'-cyclic phosphodiesterase [Sphingomonas sp.]MBX9796038.1 RNA 2',3'-cyclic phosphodiesterase [Sphingomonas sp.]
MHRLFIGLCPPPPIRARLLAIMGGVPGARWQDDAQLHLTLRFIGEVDGRVAADIADLLATIHAPAPKVAIRGVGAFDRKGRPDAIWAGVAPAAPLAALHRKIDHLLVRLGLAPEGRAFVPHITLARLARGADARAATDAFLTRHAGLTSDMFSCDDLILYESHLGHGGAAYRVAARWPLG